MRSKAGAWLACLVGFGSSANADPVFEDVTVPAGVSYLQHVAQEPPNCIFGSFCEVDRMSGGAAVADVDGDGDLDLFVTRLDAPDILFRNRGDGTFEAASPSAGFAAYDLQSNGASFGDIDNDGDPDLFVTVIGEQGDPINFRNYLFVNDGTGAFSEAAVARGATASSSPRSTFGVAFGDYDRDGFLDVHVTEWLPVQASNARLLRNHGQQNPGHFSDETSAAGVSQTLVDGFASSFTDLDGDGWPDLVVAADFGSSRLYWNDGDGSFTNGTVSAGVGSDENGMGSTFGDFDADGDLDWFVTSIFDPAETCEVQVCDWGYSGNRLYRYDGARSFADATDSAGVRDGAWGWGAAFFDYDNDSDLDLVMTNGVDFPGTAADAPFNADAMRFWRNDGPGTMTEVATSLGVSDTGSGKGLLVFDYDDDGDLDLFVVNNAGTPRLYRNDGGNQNSWLRVRVQGTRSNRDGLGARVRVQTTPNGPWQMREIGNSTHFLGQSERVAHFGLGPGVTSVHSLEVTWPRGGTRTFSNLAANYTFVAVEPVNLPTLSKAGLALLLSGLVGAACTLLCRHAKRPGRAGSSAPQPIPRFPREMSEPEGR